MSTTNTVISLGKLLLQFGRTNRATYHEDGVTPESDTDHTVMLGIIACACAERFASGLDRGKIAQFALVHDLVEVYAQDTPTLRMMDLSEKEQKVERERAALERIDREFRSSFPWLPEMIHDYESLDSPEARFIKVLDKILPKITHILNGGVAVREQGHRTREDVARVYEPQRQQIEMYASEWPDVIQLWEGLVGELYAVLDNVQQ